jgi:hypothetical protein
MFAGKARAYPSVAPLRCSTLGPSPQTGLPGTNTLAYLSVNDNEKSFITLRPEGLHSHRGRHQVREPEEPHHLVRQGYQENKVTNFTNLT